MELRFPLGLYLKMYPIVSLHITAVFESSESSSCVAFLSYQAIYKTAFLKKKKKKDQP